MIFNIVLLSASLHAMPLSDPLSLGAGFPNTVAASTGKTAKDGDDKTVCRSTSETGTRFPIRICKKRSEWEAERREAQEALRGANRQSGTCGQRC